MRWTFLLVVAAVIVPVFGQTPSPDFYLLKKPVAPFDISKFRFPSDNSHPSKYRQPESYAVTTDPVCFTVRTYVVERDRPQSDVTRVVGSSSCQWSSQFTVKSAVETGR